METFPPEPKNICKKGVEYFSQGILQPFFISKRGGFVLHVEDNIFGSHGLSFAKDEASVYRICQFPDIARPMIRDQFFEHGGIDMRNLCVQLPAVKMEEIFG